MPYLRQGGGLSGTIWQRIFSLPLVGLVLTLPATREVSFSYHLIAVGSLPVLPLSPGHDDPYSFKRSLFGGGDYHVPGDFLRTDVFRVGLAVRGFSSLPHPPSLELKSELPKFMGMGFDTVLV